MFRSWFVAAVVMLVCAPPVLGAMRVDKLYSADIQVSGQGHTERAQALHQALQEVITRLAGSWDPSKYPGLEQALTHPTHYVQEYRYHRLPPGAAPSAGAAPAQVLRVRFDPGAVNQLLQDNGLAVWGVDRPVTLVWLAVEEGTQRDIVSADTRDDIRTELQKQAQLRGLPLLFPLMDLEDRSKLAFADLWGGFMDTVRTASARYSPDAILVGRMDRGPDGKWVVRWLLANQGQRNAWTSTGSDLVPALDSGVDTLADTLAARYAQASGQSAVGPVTLLVSGMASLADYARVGKYLASLPMVQRAQIRDAQANQATYDIQVRGDAAALAQSFALGSVLEPAPAPAGTDSGGGASATAAPPGHAAAANELHYRLMP